MKRQLHAMVKPGLSWSVAMSDMKLDGTMGNRTLCTRVMNRELWES